MKIFPIAVTKGDLTQLIEICQEVLGYSPTRGLDDAHMDVQDPAAFLSILRLDNKPAETLRQGRKESSILSHFSVSFAAVIPIDLVALLSNISRLKIFTKAGKREAVCILSGTLDEWYDAIVAGCSVKADSEIRALLSETLRAFERVGFRELFNSFERQPQPDNSIILVQRGHVS